MLNRFRLALRTVFLRRRLEQEMQEEMASHLGQATERLMARGLTKEEARRAARREFGNVEYLQEKARDARGSRWIESTIADLRFAFRTLTRSPWFTALAVVTLALGIGLNTALFSLVDSVLLRALPFKDSDQLVEIWGQDDTRAGMRVPGPLLEALRERSRTLQAIAIHSPASLVLRTREGATNIRGDRVSANFVDVFGVPPLAGRGFLPEEEKPGAPAVMLISYRFWQRHLGGDPTVVGRTLNTEEIAYTVVGIMPPEFRTSFRGSINSINDDYWTPFANESTRELERESGYELVARLSPGATIREAQRELQAIEATVPVEGFADRGRRLGLLRLKNEIVGDSARALTLLFAAMGVVLAIVCANLALLLLSRSDRRISEFATRKAIGAASARLFRLALVESLLLSVAGGIAGVALAYGALPVMLALAPEEIPRIAEAAIDWRALTVAAGLTILTGCAFGLAPALRLSRLSVMQAMKRAPGRASSGQGWFRSSLVSGQVAASIALCVLAGLVGRTFLTLLPSNPGFDAESLSVFLMSLPHDKYPNPSGRARLVAELLRRVETLPGVAEAGVASNIPFSTDESNTPVRDANAADATTRVTADLREISPNYYRLLHMPLLRGRPFTSADGENTPGVAIVNATLARRLEPGGDVLGRTVRVGRSARAPAYQIVGVVANARSTGSSIEILNEIYIPHAQRGPSFNYLIVRSALNADQLTLMLRREIRSVAPALPLGDNRSAIALADLVRQSLAGPRFTATLASAFSTLAVLLAAMGVFGLVANSVSQRRHEFGIRAALGAAPRKLAMTAVRSTVAMTVVGVALGLAGAAYLTRFVENQLYAIEPLDLPTFIGVTALMLVVAGVAASIPARRAVRVNPMAALRSE